MKKLKIIFPLFLISLLFIPKVSALVTKDFSLRTSNFTNVISYLNSHSGATADDYYKLLIEYTGFEPTYSNYVCNYTNNAILCYSSDTSFSIETFKSGNNYFLALKLPTSTIYQRAYYEFTFNGSYEPVSVTQRYNNESNTSSDGSGGYILYYANANTSYDIGFIPVASTTEFLDLITLTGSNKVDSISFNGSGVSYQTGQQVFLPAITYGTSYFSEVLDIFAPDPNPYACILSAGSLGFRDSSISHIKEFSFRINGDIPPNDYGYEGEIILQKSSDWINDSSMSFDITTNNLSTNSDNIDINAYYTWENSTNQLIIHYTIDSLNQNDSEYANVIIYIKPDSASSETFLNGTLNLFICKPSNLDNDITYGYIDNVTGNTISTDYALINFLNNTNNPDLNIFNNLSGLLPSGPVDSILTIPLQMLNAINNFLGDNCTPITVNLPFVNQNIQLKCIRSFYSDINANTFFEGVGSIASVVILVQYFISLYNWIEDHMQLSHKKLKSWGAGEV